MSLPVPSSAGTSRAPLADPKQLHAMDAPLIALTQQCNGDLRQLMHAFFSFLHRRTDFYLVPHPDDIKEGKSTTFGFQEGDAEKLLIAAFRQFPLRRIPKGGKRESGTGTSSTGMTGTSKQQPQPQAAPAKQPTSRSRESEGSTKNTSAAADKLSTAHDKTEGKTPSADSTADKKTPSSSTKDSDRGNMEGVRYNDENGLQVPVGNGGSTPNYKWTQTIDETTVLIGTPEGLRGRDLSVEITPTSLAVQTKKPLQGDSSALTFCSGTLAQKVRPDESTWSIEGGVIILILDKVQKVFWKAVLEGDEEIDTELVDNRRRVGEYDDATQAQIRKIIFDQEQYHKGLPSSDELLGNSNDKSIPPLPEGVEYIDQKKLDEVQGKKKTDSSQGKQND